MHIKESEGFPFILTVPSHDRSKNLNTLPFKLLPRGLSKPKPKYETLIVNELTIPSLKSPPRISRKLSMKLTKKKRSVFKCTKFDMKSSPRDYIMEDATAFQETRPCTPRSQIVRNTSLVLDRNKRVPRINRNERATFIHTNPCLKQPKAILLKRKP